MSLKPETNLKLLLLVLLSAVTMSARAQTLTVIAKSESLKTVLEKIETSSEYIFIYNSRNLDINRVVSINSTNEPIEKVLDKLFAGSEVVYKIDGRQVVLCYRQSEVESRKVDSSPTPLVIKGRILDRTGQSVIGASVIEKGTGNGVVAPPCQKLTDLCHGGSEFTIWLRTRSVERGVPQYPEWRGRMKQG